MEVIGLVLGAVYFFNGGAVKFISLLKKPIVYVKKFGKKGIKDLKGLSKKKKIELFDELEELEELEIPKNKIRKELIKDVPGVKIFNKWFNDLTPDEFDALWENIKLRNKVKSRLRHPGGLHEWLMVSRAHVFKRWGVTADEIKDLRTKIELVIFKNPPGYHGGPGSTKAHNEILKLIDSSSDYLEFKTKLISWSEERLQGGKKSLPEGFFK